MTTKAKTTEIAEGLDYLPLLWLGLFRSDDLQQSGPCHWLEMAPVAPVSKAIDQLTEALPKLQRIAGTKTRLDEYAECLAKSIRAGGRRYLTLDCTDLDEIFEGEFNADYQRVLESLQPRKRLAIQRAQSICGIDASLDVPPLDEYLAGNGTSSQQADSVMSVLGYGDSWRVPAKKRASRSTAKKKVSKASASGESKMPKGWKSTPRRKYVLHETKLYAADWDWAVQQLRDSWIAILDFLETAETPRSSGYFLYEIQGSALRFRTADGEPERRRYPDRKVSKHVFRMEMTLVAREFKQVPDEKQSEHNFWVGTKRIARRIEWALRSASAEEPLKSRLKQLKKAASFQPFFAAENLKGESNYVIYPDKLSLTRPRTAPNMIGSTK